MKLDSDMRLQDAQGFSAPCWELEMFYLIDVIEIMAPASIILYYVTLSTSDREKYSVRSWRRL